MDAGTCVARHPEPFFLEFEPGPLGQRFCLHHAPPGPLRGLVVHVHPFAEEMNKSRRMAALQSRALADAGFAVLQMDLLGCGDSAGDFGDASWAQWLADVVHACRWLQHRHGEAAQGEAALPLWLWGHRAGALLAVQAAQQLDTPCNFLFWQPATTGKLLLQQFLRLKAASDLLGGQAKAVMTQLRDELAAGRSVEVAGYTLPAALCSGLAQVVLKPPALAAHNIGRVVWIELSNQPEATLSPASTSASAEWQAVGWDVHTQVAPGPAFWQTTEIEDAPALLAASLDAISRNRAAKPQRAAEAQPG